MSIHLDRVAAALSAYPWTPGALTKGAPGAGHYCAIGALLRYAGVAQDHIACDDFSVGDLPRLFAVYGGLLETEYGLADMRTAGQVMLVNDTAPSQEQAIERVLRLLSRSPYLRGIEDLEREVQKPLKSGVVETTHVETVEWGPEPDDGAGSLALLG